MVRSGIQGGAIACSVLVIYGWAQAAATETPTQCQSSRAAPSGKNHDRCHHSAMVIGTLSSIPEKLSQLRWSSPFGAVRSPDRSLPLPGDIETNYQRMLTRAQSQRKQGQLVDAIAIVAGIPRNSRYSAAAQQLREDWSGELLRQATQTYRQAKMDRAILLLNAIPMESDRHARAMELRQQWNREGQLLRRAIAARQSRDWQASMDALRSLQGTALFQSAPVQSLLQECLTKLYEPDERLLQIASEGMPAMGSVAPPETLRQ
jgi:hypothetical protein